MDNKKDILGLFVLTLLLVALNHIQPDRITDVIEMIFLLMIAFRSLYLSIYCMVKYFKNKYSKD